jgi:hypothetical protein
MGEVGGGGEGTGAGRGANGGRANGASGASRGGLPSGLGHAVRMDKVVADVDEDVADDDVATT